MNRICMILISFLFAISSISSLSSKRRLIAHAAMIVPYSEGAGLLGPNGHGTNAGGGRPPVAGFFGQDCTPDTGDYPDKCPLSKTMVPPHPINNPVHGKIECIHNFDCCTCREFACTPDCTDINCNGDSGCFGVKNITIDGDVTGADILCNGDLGCMGTAMTGHNIRAIQCTGDGSCAYSNFDLTCLNEGCLFACLGDNSCEAQPGDIKRQAMYNIRNAAGMMCSHDSCRYGTYNLLPALPADIICGGEMSCVGAIITTEHLTGLFCGGQKACRGAKIVITNPTDGFSLTCTGFNGCENLDIEIIISDPTIHHFRSITCAARMSCRNMLFTVHKMTPPKHTVSIDELSCAAAEACKDAVFDLPPGVTFGTCACAPLSTMACDGTIGIDSCLQGLDKLECVGGNSCENLSETIRNPADMFELLCGDANSCKNFELEILLDGTTGTSHFKGVTCGAGNSCEGLSLSVINTGPDPIDAGLISCGGPNSCLNAKFNAINANFQDFICGSTEACSKCESTVDNVCTLCDPNETGKCPIPIPVRTPPNNANVNAVV